MAQTTYRCFYCPSPAEYVGAGPDVAFYCGEHVAKAPGEVELVEGTATTRFVLEVDVEGLGPLARPYILARLADALDGELNQLRDNRLVGEDWTVHTKWTKA